MINELSIRFLEVLNYLTKEGLVSDNKDFASKISVSTSMITEISKGRSNVGLIAIQNTVLNFPVNSDWILTGKGSMLRTNDASTPEPLPSINQEYKGAPYYNVDFIGGFEFVSNDQTQLPDYYINYPPYNKPGVMWCNLTGHSMEPEISNGDVIALKEVRSPIEYLPAGEIYGIITDDYRTVKRIRPGVQKGFVRLIPANKSPEFCEQEIPVEMIRRVFAVLGSIRKFF